MPAACAPITMRARRTRGDTLPEPFKNLLNAGLVRRAASHIGRAASALSTRFDERGFVHTATADLDTLEMKARAMRIADALEQALPQDFTQAVVIIEAALAPPFEQEGLADMHAPGTGLAGWILWPVGEYIARRGLAHPALALESLRALTQRFSAEFAIRPFIAAHPTLAFSTLERWTADPNLHVRRLVSEGSRPRLPWGMQLKALVADPRPTLPLLRRLQDDPSAYVRRSVANHLNDIAKDHPSLLADWLAEHLPGASAERTALLRHASRTLVKKGDTRILSLWGQGARYRGDAALAIRPATVTVGGEVTLALALQSTARSTQSLVVDYIVHHVRANGRTSPKVFKGWQLVLAPGEHRELVRRHSLRPVTTRPYHRGRHLVVAQVNGRAVAESSFMLREA